MVDLVINLVSALENEKQKKKKHSIIQELHQNHIRFEKKLTQILCNQDYLKDQNFLVNKTLHVTPFLLDLQKELEKIELEVTTLSHTIIEIKCL